MNNNDKKKSNYNTGKVNYKNLNNLIQTGNKISKILLVLGICTLVVLAFYIIEKLNIINILKTILGLLFPLFFGLAIAWLFEPIIRYLEKNKIKRPLGSIIVYLMFILISILLIVLVVPEFVSQLKELISQIPAFLEDASKFVNNFLDNFKDSDIDIITIEKNIIENLELFVTNLTTNSFDGIISGLTSFLSSLVQVLLGLIIAFYISLDFSKFKNYIRSIIPKRKKQDIMSLLTDLNDMARGYVSGTILSSIIVIIFTFIGLLISGITTPLLWAVFCGIANIIPYFGPYIGGIPVIIVAFSISPACGVVAAITIVLVQFIEGNIIHPLLVSKATDIHPITLVVGLIVFEHFFGIVGMILATPIIGTFKILFKYFDEKYELKEKILPKDEEKAK